MYLRNIAVQSRSISADGVYDYALPVNPISVINIIMRPLHDTGTLANNTQYLDMCAALNRVSVLYRGEAIISMRGEDIAAMNFFRHGIMPHLEKGVVNNDMKCCVLPILMGRWPYSKESVFPATSYGELQLQLDIDIADTGYDGMTLSVETVEILDAKPKEYEKRVQVGQTFSATGDQDMDLVCAGNLCRGILLFGTTPFGPSASPVPSWGRIKLLLNGQEAAIASADWEAVRQDYALWGRQPPANDSHKHIITTDGNVQTELSTLAGPISVGSGGWEKYAFLDFDPTGDDGHSLSTAGKSRLIIRSNVETADAVRAVPVEVIRV